MGKLTIILGPPCAGKSTWCRENAADGDVVVDFDLLAQALGAKNPHAAPKAVAGVAFSARDAIVDHLLGKGVEPDAYVIHTSPQPAKVQRYADAGAAFLVLDPGMDECLARAEADGRPEGTAEVIASWYENPPQLPEPKATPARHKGGPEVRTKQYPVFVKAPTDTEAAAGIVEMVVSTYAVDSWGDQVIPGAFAETLAEWKTSGDPIPFIWSHQHSDPDAHIGVVLEAEERLQPDPTTTPPTPAGLWIKAQVDLEEPFAAKVYRLLKGRRVKQASFAYDVVEGGPATKDGQRVYELRQLQLFEVGPTLIGMNQGTQLLNAKALNDALAHAKAGRVLSAKNEDLLRDAHRQIGEVLSMKDGEDDAATDEGAKAGSPATKHGQEPPIPIEPANAEEPSGANAEEPMQRARELERLERTLQLAALGI